MVMFPRQMSVAESMSSRLLRLSFYYDLKPDNQAEECLYPLDQYAIQRFFGVFTWFVNVRRGFHSVIITKRELIVVQVVYMFAQYIDSTAPIETILPDATLSFMNDPFACFL